MKELLFFLILYLYIRIGLLASTRVSGVSPEIYMLPDKNVDFLKFYLIITEITSLTFDFIYLIYIYLFCFICCCYFYLFTMEWSWPWGGIFFIDAG